MGILKGRRLLIVGVRNRRSLAHAIATQALADGAALAFSTQPVGDKAYDKTATIIAGDFPNAPVFSCDAGEDDDIINAVDSAAAALGGLDGLVHAIAYAKREAIVGAYYEGIDRAAFGESLDISAYTLTAFANAARLHFVKAGGGSIVTLTYLGAERALPNYNVMGVAKAALEASVRYLAYSMGAQGIRVNAVSAGPVKTLAAAGIGDFSSVLWQVEQQAPLRRNISAAEVATATSFLLSEMASGVSGEVLHVDGGFHITAGISAANHD